MKKLVVGNSLGYMDDESADGRYCFFCSLGIGI